VSLVVCTRNRATRLERLLATVAALEQPPSFELVVVDNGSTDATPAVLRRFARDATVPVRVVSEPVPGLGRARNRGIATARAALVTFTDDDCLLPPGHLAAVVAAFAELDVDWIGGRILDGGEGQARVALLEDRTFRYFPPRGAVWVGAVQGANLAVRRAALEGVGGFDVRLGAGTPFRCEDVELCARLAGRGHRGARMPSLTVHHAHGRDEPEGRALEAANDIARGAFVAQRLLDGAPCRRAYLALWTAQVAQRWGWRPTNAARSAAATARELVGAARWSAVSIARRVHPAQARLAVSDRGRLAS
jgi:GT2 family glycosyltransferase